MARKSDGEKIDELQQLVTTLKVSIDNIHSEIQTLAELRMKVAVLEERLNELKRAGEESGRKLWAMLPPLVAIVVGSLLTLLIQLFLSSRR